MTRLRDAVRRRRRERSEGGEPPACRVCGRTLEDGRLYDVRGSHGRCAIALHGIPCRICPAGGHPRRWAEPGFEGALADALLADPRVPRARTKAFGRPRCHACGRRLKATAGERATVFAELTLGSATFTVELAGPAVTCDRCGTAQLSGERALAGELSEAFRRAIARSRLET
ncbi:MAG: hypothetical protein ACRELC_11035, partial [Gemmatimonadota bacterium]